MTRALVTGASGFVGTHLVQHLLALGWDVAAYDLQLQPVLGDRSYQGNIYGDETLSRALHEFQPEVIFHLAGRLKSERPDDFYQAHVLGTVALFEATQNAALHSRVIVASSSAVYGSGNEGQPIDESFTPMPVTHYAVSKLAQEWVALRYHNAAELNVACVRTFNLLGPGLSPLMAPSAFAQQVAQAEAVGVPSQIRTGDLSARRDYVDVRDAVRAYAMIAERGLAGQVYNVCSGEAVSMQEILQMILDQARIPVEAVLDPARVQKNDVPIQVGSAEKLKHVTGWERQIPVKQSLIDLVNDWREKVKLDT